jgi:hypothetical protein
MKILIVLTLFLLTGCASASPLDFLIPTPVLPVTTNYLGHITPPKMNRIYHSLRDTKNETALLEVRKTELDALYMVAKTGNGLVEDTFDPISDMLWIALLGATGGTCLAIPKPGTKAKIERAQAEVPS